MAATRIGPFHLAAGWSRGNAATVWLASFFTMMALLNAALLVAAMLVRRRVGHRKVADLGI